MKLRFCFCLTLLGTLVLPVQGQPRPKLSPEALAVVRGNNAFACDLHQKLRAEPGNLFYSPYSISSALAMTYAGARGTTAEQMARTLHFPRADHFHQACGELYRCLNAPNVKREYKLNIANRLWGQKGYTFDPDFLKLTETVYGAGLKDLDFQNATEAARQAINRWVEQATQDRIKDLIQQGVLTNDTRLVLTNAIYFKAAWAEAFPEPATQDGDFRLADGGQVKARMMHKGETMPYLKHGDLELAVLPYNRHELSMIVLLPKKADGLPALEKNLNTANLEQWLKNATMHDVDLKLPKFKMTAQFKLAPALAEMGMPLAFSDNADFSGMTTREKLKISQVIHKAFVDVNEKGTEAAAATAVIIRPTSAPIGRPRATFHADRPFLFVLRDNQSGAILFLGRVTNPKG